VMEESLGKGGKGVVAFDDLEITANGRCSAAAPTLWVTAETDAYTDPGATGLLLQQSYLSGRNPLVSLAASFLGWQLTVALYGYLNDITFSGQPAVEGYKTRARELREQPDPVATALAEGQVISDGSLTLIAPPGTPVTGRTPGAVFGAALAGCPLYLDLTENGESGWLRSASRRLAEICREDLGIPVKLRHAPAAYHATEQSEVDGPPGLLSLRLLLRSHEQPLIGSYTDTFLTAQAIGSWQAMVARGRACYLLIADTPKPISDFFRDAEQTLRQQPPLSPPRERGWG